jgi:2-deoxy-D-gluconate 3-dehydrogenase
MSRWSKIMTNIAAAVNEVEGKVAIVTGAASGIGRAIAELLHARGAKVVAEDIDPSVKELERDGMVALVADVTVDGTAERAVALAVDTFGRLDILVNNAGMNIRKPPQALTLGDWRQVMDTNLTSAFVISQAAYPHLKRAGAGKIINTGSMMSIFGAAYLAPYAASKAGIVQLTKALACAWAKDNIQVNAVLPGWIDTAMTQKARVELTGLNERVLSRTPAGRWGEPADMAGIAVFLASPASDFITGAAIPVDGGYSSQG